MGRSEPGGEKERELVRMTTKVIAAGRRGRRRAFDWRTFNEKRLNQARTGLFIQNLCETEHAGDYERVGIFILESPKDLGRLYEMVPVRIVINSHWEPPLPNAPGKDKLWEERALRLLLPKARQGGNVPTEYTNDRNSPHNSKSFIVNFTTFKI